MSQLQFDYSSHHSDSDCYGSCTLTHVREATPITQLQWNNILSQCIEQWAKYRDIYIYIYISYHRAGLSYSVNLVVYVILYCLHYWIDWDWILLAKTKQNMDTWVINCIVCLSFFYEVFHCSINLSLPSFELLTGRLTCYKIEYPDSLRSVACFNGNQSYVDHWKGDCCQCTQSRQSKAHQR